MANERISQAKRIKTSLAAEREIMRFADNDPFWFKHICNIDLDPIQRLKCEEMHIHPNTLDFSARRTGKTAVKELFLLKYQAVNPDQSLGIVAPREAQSIDNLNYHLESIRGSEILSAYIRYKSGRRQLSDTYYQFENRSVARAYGIMAQVDGGDLTMASLEEVDDMPAERLYSRFLLMLGSTRRLGASKDSVNDPQIRITGVFKGADTLTDLIASGKYHVLGALHGSKATLQLKRYIDEGWLDQSQVDINSYSYPLPLGNAVYAMSLGLLNKAFILDMRDQLSPDEFARQLLCVNTSSRNLIWEKWLAWSKQLGVKASIDLAPPVPGKTYKKRGRIAFGYDASGHGENATASRHALVVGEELAGFFVPIWAKVWPAGADEGRVKDDLKSHWRYFMPDSAIGDAYGVGMLTQLCLELYGEGLTDIDIRAVGESTASNWPQWPFAPLRFEGMQKHNMATLLQSLFYNKRCALPYLEHLDDTDEDVKTMHLLYQQLTNIKAEETAKSYSSYKMARKDIGDDLFDAAMACAWGMLNASIEVPTIILMDSRKRNELTKEVTHNGH